MTQGSVKDTTGYVNYVYNISARGVTQVSSQLLGLSGVASSILGQLAFQTTSYLSETEGALMTMGVVATAGLTKATQQAMEFDQALSTISAISGKSGSAIDNLGEQAMDMSERFGVAVGDMTKGLESLARAGVSAGNMSAILEQAMGLSKLEGLSLETAINDLISTTNLLDTKGLDLESPEYAEAVKYQNQKITATSEAAPINAQDIIHTLEHVGGYASSTNIDQDDLYAVIAQLGSKGTKSEIAGTSLRAFLAAGQKDTAQRALKRIGLNVKDLWKNDDTIMSITDMKDVLDEAMESKGYTQQEKLEFYSDFAGYKQANQIMKIDTTSAREFKEKIDRSWDISKKIETVIGTAETNFQGMVQAGLNFVTKVGKPLLPIISTISWTTKTIINFIDKIPGSHLLVTSGLVLLAIKGISTIFNKIGPQLLESTNNVATMSDFFNDIRESLEKSFFIMKNWNNLDVLQDEAFEIEVNRIDNEDRIRYYQEQGYDVKTPEEIIKLRNKADDEEIIARKRARLEAAAVKKEKEDKKDERVGKNRKSTPKKKSYEAITKPMGEIKGVLDNINETLRQFPIDNEGTTVLETTSNVDLSKIEDQLMNLISITGNIFATQSNAKNVFSIDENLNVEAKAEIDNAIISDLKRHIWKVEVVGPVATLTKKERDEKWKKEGWTMDDFFHENIHRRAYASTGQSFGGNSRYLYHGETYEDYHMSSDAQRRRGRQKRADAKRAREQRKKAERRAELKEERDAWRAEVGPVYGETPTPDYNLDGSYGFNTTMNNAQPRRSNFDVGVKRSDFRTAKGRVSGIIRQYDRQHKGAEIGSVEKLTDIFLEDQNSPVIKEIKSLMTKSWGDQAEKNLSDLFKQMAPIRTRGTVRLSDSDFIDLKFEETGSETLDSVGSRIGEKLKQYQDFMNNIGFSFSSDLDVEKDMKELEKVRSQVLKIFGEARLNLSETNPQELQDVLLSLNSTYRVPTKSNIAILADAFGLLGKGNITKENIFSNKFKESVKPEFESKVNLEQAALVLGSIYQSPLMQSLESIQSTAGIDDSDFLTDVVSIFNETMEQHSDLQLSMRALQTHAISGKLIKGNNKLENIIYSLAAESATNENQDGLASFIIDFTENMQHFYGIQDETTRKTIDKAKDYDAAVRKSIEKEMAENPEQMLYMSEEEGVFTIEDAGRHSERAASIGNSKRVSAGEEYGSDYDPHSEMYEYKFDEDDESYDVYEKNRDKDLGTVASSYTLQQLLGEHGTTINDIAEILHGQKEGNVKDAETALEYFLSKLNTREDRNELLASFGLAKGSRINIDALDPSAVRNDQYYNTQYGRNTAFFNGVELGTLNPNKGGYTYHLMKLFEDIDPLLKKMSAIQHELQLATDIDFLRELGLLEEEFEDTTSFLRAIHHLIADVHVKGKALQNRHRGYRGLGDADTPGATTGIAIREQGNVAANKNVGKILPRPEIDKTEHAGKNYVKERLENRPLSTIAHMAAPLRTRAALPETGGMKLGIKHVTTGMSKEEYENSIFSEIPWLMMRAKSPGEVMYALDGQNDKGDIATWLKNEAGNYANIWTPEAMLKRTASIEMGNVIQSLGSLALYDKTSGEEGDEHIITQANVKDIAANNLSDSMLDVVDFMYQSQGFSTLKDLKLKAGSNYDKFSAQVRHRMDTAAPEEGFEADEQANNQFKRWVNDEELERLKKEGLFLDDNDFVHDTNGNAIKRMHGKGDNKEQQHLIYDWEALRLSKEEIGQQYTVMMMANAMLAQEKMTQKMAADSDVYNEFTAQIRDLSGTILVDPKAFLSMNSDDLVAYGATKDIGFKQITEALDVLTSTDVSPEKITALLQDVTVGDLGSEFISKLEERGYYTDLDDETFYATNVATIAESFGGTYELVVDILKDIVFSMSQIREMNQIFDSKGVIAQSVQEETLNAMAEVEAEKYNTDAKKELAILKKNVDINKKKSGLGMSMGDDFGMNPMTGVISGVAPGDSFEKTNVNMPYSIQDNTPDMWKQGFAAPFVDDVKDFIANSADLTKEQYENLAEGLAPDVRDFVMQYKNRIVGFHNGSETMKGIKEDIHQFLTDRFNSQAKEQNLGDVTAQKQVFDSISYKQDHYDSGYVYDLSDEYMSPSDIMDMNTSTNDDITEKNKRYREKKYTAYDQPAGPKYVNPIPLESNDLKQKRQNKKNKNDAIKKMKEDNKKEEELANTLEEMANANISFDPTQTYAVHHDDLVDIALDLSQNMGLIFQKREYGAHKVSDRPQSAFSTSSGTLGLDLTYDDARKDSGEIVQTIGHEFAHILGGHFTEEFEEAANALINPEQLNIDDKTKEQLIQQATSLIKVPERILNNAHQLEGGLAGWKREQAENFINNILMDPVTLIKEYESTKIGVQSSRHWNFNAKTGYLKLYSSLLEAIGIKNEIDNSERMDTLINTIPELMPEALATISEKITGDEDTPGLPLDYRGGYGDEDIHTTAATLKKKSNDRQLELQFQKEAEERNIPIDQVRKEYWDKKRKKRKKENDKKTEYNQAKRSLAVLFEDSSTKDKEKGNNFDVAANNYKNAVVKNQEEINSTLADQASALLREQEAMQEELINARNEFDRTMAGVIKEEKETINNVKSKSSQWINPSDVVDVDANAFTPGMRTSSVIPQPKKKEEKEKTDYRNITYSYSSKTQNQIEEQSERYKQGREQTQNIVDHIKSQVAQVTSFTANKVSGIIDTSKNKEANELLGGINNNLIDTTELLKGANSVLDEFTGIFPPLTIAVLGLSAVISGIGKIASLNDKFNKFIELGTVMENDPTKVVKNLFGHKITGETNIGQITMAASSGLSKLFLAIESFIANNLGPLLLIVGAFTAIKTALDWSYKSHEKYVKQLQDEEKTNKSRSKSLQVTTAQSKKAYEENKNERQEANLARKYALNKQKLDAANLTRISGAIDLSNAQNDTLWGQYGISAALNKMQGKYESTAAEYDGTSGQIRRIKEHTTGGQGLIRGMPGYYSQAEEMVAAYYDANQLAIGVMDEYKDELGELYDAETNAMRKHPDENPRETKEFQMALDKFVEATGITKEHAQQYLDYMQTEHNVDNATQAMQAQADLISANTEMKIQAIAFGGNPSDVLGLNGIEAQQNAMVQAQADMIQLELSSQLWWKAVWSTITTPIRVIIAPIFAITHILGAIWSFITGNWGAAGMHMKQAGASLNVLGETATYWGAWATAESTDFNSIGQGAIDENDRANYGNAQAIAGRGGPRVPNAEDNSIFGIFPVGWPDEHRFRGHGKKDHKDQLAQNAQQSFLSQLMAPIAAVLGTISGSILTIITILGVKLLNDKFDIVSKLPNFMQGPIQKIGGAGRFLFDNFMPEKGKKAIFFAETIMKDLGSRVYHGIENRIPESWKEKFNTAKEWVKNKVGLGDEEKVTEDDVAEATVESKNILQNIWELLNGWANKKVENIHEIKKKKKILATGKDDNEDEDDDDNIPVKIKKSDDKDQTESETEPSNNFINNIIKDIEEREDNQPKENWIPGYTKQDGWALDGIDNSGKEVTEFARPGHMKELLDTQKNMGWKVETPGAMDSEESILDLDDIDQRPKILSQAVRMQYKVPEEHQYPGETVAMLERQEDARKNREKNEKLSKGRKELLSDLQENGSQAVRAQLTVPQGPVSGGQNLMNRIWESLINPEKPFEDQVPQDEIEKAKAIGKHAADEHNYEERRKHFRDLAENGSQAVKGQLNVYDKEYGPHKTREEYQKELDEEFATIDSSKWKENYETIAEAQRPKSKLAQKGKAMKDLSAQYQAAQTLGQMMENPQATAYDASNKMEGVQICDQCGHKNPIDAKVCEACGARLDGKGKIGGFLSNKFEKWKHTISGDDQGEMSLSHRLQQLSGMGKRAQRKRKTNESAMDAGMKNMGLFSDMMNNPSEMAEKARTQGLKICPECGHQNPPDAIHCEECGARLDGRGKIGGFFADKFTMIKGKVKSKTTDKIKDKISKTKESAKSKIDSTILDTEAKTAGPLGSILERIGNSDLYNKIAGFNLDFGEEDGDDFNLKDLFGNLDLGDLFAGGFDLSTGPIIRNEGSWAGLERKRQRDKEKEGKKVDVPIQDMDETNEESESIPIKKKKKKASKYKLHDGKGTPEVILSKDLEQPESSSKAEEFKRREGEFYNSIFEKSDLKGLVSTFLDPSASMGDKMKQLGRSSWGLLSHEDVGGPVLSKVAKRQSKAENPMSGIVNTGIDVLTNDSPQDVVTDKLTEGKDGVEGVDNALKNGGKVTEKIGGALKNKKGVTGKIGNTLENIGSGASKAGNKGTKGLLKSGVGKLGKTGVGKAVSGIGKKAIGSIGKKLATKGIAQVGSKVLGGALMATGIGAPLGLLLESPIGGALIEGAMDLGGKALGAVGGAVSGIGKALGFGRSAIGGGGGLLGAAGGALGGIAGAAGGLLGSVFGGGGPGNMGKMGSSVLQKIGAPLGGVVGVLTNMFSNDKQTKSLNEKMEAHAGKTLEAVREQNNKTASTTNSSGGNITIQNININTADDPEAIKAMFLELLVELQEQVNPRLVSRTAGKPPANSTSSSSPTDSTTDPNNTDPNNPNNTNTNGTDTNSTGTNSTGTNGTNTN